MNNKKKLKISNFRDIEKFHHFSNQLFDQYQSALMHGEYKQAKQLIFFIRKIETEHIRDEEDILIPIFKKHYNPVPQGSAIEFYTREHEQIVGYLNRFCDQALMWEKENPTDKIALVRLFDDHYRFKHLVEHHFTREETFLFKLLDRLAGKFENSGILNQLEIKYNGFISENDFQ